MGYPTISKRVCHLVLAALIAVSLLGPAVGGAIAQNAPPNGTSSNASSNASLNANPNSNANSSANANVSTNASATASNRDRPAEANDNRPGNSAEAANGNDDAPGNSAEASNGNGPGPPAEAGRSTRSPNNTTTPGANSSRSRDYAVTRSPSTDQELANASANRNDSAVTATETPDSNTSESTDERASSADRSLADAVNGDTSEDGANDSESDSTASQAGENGANDSDQSIQPDITVRSAAELAQAAENAPAGANIYVPPEATITLEPRQVVFEQRGITLYSDGGQFGEGGATIRMPDEVPRDQSVYSMIELRGADSTVSGLRIIGPHPNLIAAETGSEYEFGISIGLWIKGDSSTVYNSEIAGWSGAGVKFQEVEDGHVYSSNVHHNTDAGTGYGVSSEQSWVLIQYNQFDANRHSIQTTRDTESGYRAEGNIQGPRRPNHAFDAHSSSKTEAAHGGRRIEIINNTFLPPSSETDAEGEPMDDPAIELDGRLGPVEGALIARNAFVGIERGRAIRQNEEVGEDSQPFADDSDPSEFNNIELRSNAFADSRSAIPANIGAPDSLPGAGAIGDAFGVGDATASQQSAGDGSAGALGLGVGKGIINWFANTWLVDKLGAAFYEFLDGIISYLGGTPTCENSGAWGVFGIPTSQPCQAFFWQFYVPIVLPLSIIIIAICGGSLGAQSTLRISLPWSTPTPRDAFARSLAATGLIISWWWFASLIEKAVNEIGLWIMPNAAELTSSTTGFLQLTGAAVFTAIAGFTLGTAEVVSLWLLYGVRDAAVIVFRFTMPLLLALALTGPHQKIRSFFSSIAWQWFTVLIIILPGAIMMRLGFIAGWEFSESSLMNLSIALGFFGVGLFSIVLLGWLSTTMYSIADKAVSSSEPLTNRADQAMDRGAERVRSKASGAVSTRTERVKERYRSWRGDDESAFQPQESGWAARGSNRGSAGGSRSNTTSTRASRFGGADD